MWHNFLKLCKKTILYLFQLEMRLIHNQCYFDSLPAIVNKDGLFFSVRKLSLLALTMYSQAMTILALHFPSMASMLW